MVWQAIANLGEKIVCNTLKLLKTGRNGNESNAPFGLHPMQPPRDRNNLPIALVPKPRRAMISIAVADRQINHIIGVGQIFRADIMKDKLMNDSRSPIIFILSWERPIYLWACLDSIYRNTRTTCRIVLADNASRDPMIHQVINGFERRGMFHAVHREKENHPKRFAKLIERYWDEIGEFFVFLEADTAIVDTDKCWLAIMTGHMRSDSKIGSIGSRVYQGDFIDIEEARALEPQMSLEDLCFLIKANAPMRKYQHTTEALICPHNPPLRLLMMRKEAYADVGFGRDTVIYKTLISKGWRSLISTEVAHRHLSLLNIYDYPEYNRKHRDSFFDYRDKT